MCCRAAQSFGHGTASRGAASSKRSKRDAGRRDGARCGQRPSRAFRSRSGNSRDRTCRRAETRENACSQLSTRRCTRETSASHAAERTSPCTRHSDRCRVSDSDTVDCCICEARTWARAEGNHFTVQKSIPKAITQGAQSDWIECRRARERRHAPAVDMPRIHLIDRNSRHTALYARNYDVQSTRSTRPSVVLRSSQRRSNPPSSLKLSEHVIRRLADRDDGDSGHCRP